MREGYELFEQATTPARASIDDRLSGATRALGSGDDPEIAVWMLLGWNRSEGVAVALPDNEVAAVIDDPTGEPVTFALTPEGDGQARFRFRAADVPEFAFRRYRLSSDASATHRESLTPTVRDATSGTILDNGRIVVRVSAWGSVLRISLAGGEANVVDTDADFAINELALDGPAPDRPEAGGSSMADSRLFAGIVIDSAVVPFQTREVTQRESGIHFDRAYMRTEVVLDDVYRWQTEVRLIEDRIGLDEQLTWLWQSETRELLSIAFPFAFSTPTIRHAAQFTVPDPTTHTPSGSTHEVFAIQN